jgi:hypothetical protein
MRSRRNRIDQSAGWLHVLAMKTCLEGQCGWDELNVQPISKQAGGRGGIVTQDADE